MKPCARCSAPGAGVVCPARTRGVYRNATEELRLCEACRLEVRAALVPKVPKLRWVGGMPTELLGKINGQERTVGWAHHRSAFVVWVRAAALLINFEIPLGRIAHKFGLVGADLDDARTLWEIQNLPPPPKLKDNRGHRPHRKTDGNGSGGRKKPPLEPPDPPTFATMSPLKPGETVDEYLAREEEKP